MFCKIESVSLITNFDFESLSLSDLALNNFKDCIWDCQIWLTSSMLALNQRILELTLEAVAFM